MRLLPELRIKWRNRNSVNRLDDMHPGASQMHPEAFDANQRAVSALGSVVSRVGIEPILP
jgi:hypothetical protein